MMKKLLLLTLIFLPQFTHAFTGEVMVNSGNTPINALEATVRLPANTSVDEVLTGNSAILIWIQAPKIDATAHFITLSGISPGGFQGKVTVFTLSGSFNESDLGKFIFSEVHAFSNDGKGTEVPVTLSVETGQNSQDVAPPEPFTSIISKSPDLFNGKSFISFIAQDKGTGVVKYEFASTWLFPPADNDWKETTSPHELNSPDLLKKIYVKALDKEGNSRTSTIAGTYHYATLLLGIIIMVCLAVFVERSFF